MKTTSDDYVTPHPAADAFSAIMGAYEAGASVGIQMCGDYTTNDRTESFETVARYVIEAIPDARVPFSFYQDSQTAYLAPAIFAEGKNASASMVSRERCVVFSGARPRRLPNTIGMVTGDLEFSQKLQHATWRSVMTLGGYWNPAGNPSGTGAAQVPANQRSWRVAINADGSVSLWISRDGTEQIEARSTVVIQVPSAPLYERRAIKVTRNMTTGVVQFFVGTEAYNSGSNTLTVTYTQLGADVTGVTGALFQNPTPTVPQNVANTSYTVAGWETVGERLTGRIYDTAIRDGINGPILNPQGMECWIADVGASDQSVIEGPATIYFHNASPNNGNFANHWLNEAKRRIMVRRQDIGILFFLANANEGFSFGRAYDANLDAFYAFVKTWAPSLTVIVLNGSPLVAPQTERAIRAQARRAAQATAWATRNNVLAIDTYRAFAKYGGAASDLIMANGNDLTAAGGKLMADTIWKALFARVGS